MQRDMRLVKLILQYVEENDKGDGKSLDPPEFPGYSATAVKYHIRLCVQAGYITATSVFPSTLNWIGHDALDNLRYEQD